MRIKKIPMNGYLCSVFNTKKYTTISMNLVFEIDYNRSNMNKCDLLQRYLLRTNDKYKTKQLIQEKLREYYGMGSSIYSYNVGKKLFFEITYTFFDPVLVKDNYINQALEFASDLLYKPRFNENKLDRNTLTVIKNELIGNIANDLVEPSAKANRGFLRQVFPNTYMIESLVNTKEEYEEELNCIKDEDIIATYNKLLNESFVGMTIMGNVTDEFLDKVKELFVFKQIKKFDYKYKEKVKINNKDKFVRVLDKDVNESRVFGLYTIDKYTVKDKAVFNVINYILNIYGRLMHKTLRDELQIVYHASSNFNRKCGHFTFFALINRENIDKCIEGFDLVLEKLQDPIYVESILPIIKKQVNISEYVKDENKWSMFDELFIRTFKTGPSSKVINKLLNSVTKEDVIEASKRIKKEVIYFYEGGRDEEK